MPMPQGAQDPMSLQFEKKEKTRPAPVTKFALHRKGGRNTILNKFLKSSATVHKEEMKGKEEE